MAVKMNLLDEQHKLWSYTATLLQQKLRFLETYLYLQMYYH